MTAAYSTMTRRADFVAANGGLRVARPGFVLLAKGNDGQGQRAGITVTKKIGNAVVRNRMKRRFRALLRDELVAALGRAHAGKGDPPRNHRGRKGKPRK